MALLECVAFVLLKDNKVLAEKRKLTKQVMPGAIALPGGHIEEGESPEDALCREIREELDVVPSDITYVCTLLYHSQAFHKIHYFAVQSWTGDIVNNEAEALLWIPFDALGTLDLDIDRIAISEYRRVYQSDMEGRSDDNGA